MANLTAGQTIVEPTNMTNMEEDESGLSGNGFMDILWTRLIVIMFYILIFIIGVSGNCLVVYVVVRNKSMQTITNIFITNLAVSDIMMCLLAVPFTPLSAFLSEWIFGEAVCHILPMSLGVCVYVSTLTSTAIAIDRYFVIVHPFKPRMKTTVCLLLIVAIWIISISISLPLGIYQKVKIENGKRICTELWPRHTARQFFTVTSLILQYIVPCSIISYCYMKVSRVLASRSKRTVGTGCRSRDRDEMEIRRKRRTNKMLIAMISIFVVCWLPLNVVLMSSEKSSFAYWDYFYLVFFIAHVIAMSSTVYNPFLYAWMNENFRKEFKTVLPALFFRSSRHCYHGNTDATQYTTVETNNPEVRKDCKTEMTVDNKDDVKMAEEKKYCANNVTEGGGGVNGVNGALEEKQQPNGDAVKEEKIEMTPMMKQLSAPTENA